MVLSPSLALRWLAFGRLSLRAGDVEGGALADYAVPRSWWPWLGAAPAPAPGTVALLTGLSVTIYRRPGRGQSRVVFRRCGGHGRVGSSLVFPRFVPGAVPRVGGELSLAVALALSTA